jgi:hypothetical protein
VNQRTDRHPPEQDPHDALATPRAASKLTGYPIRQLLALIEAGELSVEKIGKSEYVSLAELERLAGKEGAR